ncbi:MAG: hydroxypyruvate isomerase [Alphaproteobacteria bacterium]|nr:MAG: hydroxypyruvate isomerase [Alphaproteobacteria bacterium]
MPNFAANLSTMFGELEFLDRFAAAAACGFRAVEYLFPYAYHRTELEARLAATGLEQVLFNAAEGDWGQGERGIAGLPGREDAFRRAVETALSYAAALGCRRIHVMAGTRPPDAALERCRDVLVANLAWAAGMARSAGVTLLLEPLNPQDFPGYLIGTAEAARSVISAVGSGTVGLQFDVYHAQMTQGRLLDTLNAHWRDIRHVQISGVPGRHEPDAHQEINFPRLFAELDARNYDGWVGCEYRPRGETVAGLAWATPYGIGRRET